MSHRRTVALAAAALFALPAGHAAAATTTTALTYQCTFPLIGAQPLTANVKLNLPSAWGAGTPTPRIELSADLSTVSSDLASQVPGLDEVNGYGLFTNTVRTAGGGAVPAPVKAWINNRSATSAAWTLQPFDAFPTLIVNDPGPAEIQLDKLTLNLTALDATGGPIQVAGGGSDSDGDPNTFDVDCTLSPAAQSTKLATFDVLQIDGAATGNVAAQCKFPLINMFTRPSIAGTVAFSSGGTSSLQAGEPFGANARITATFPGMGRAFDAPRRIDGVLNAKLSLIPVGGGASIPVTGQLAIGKAPYIGSGEADLVLDAFGKLSGGVVPTAGEYQIRLDAISPNVTLWDAQVRGPVQFPPFTTDLDGNSIVESDSDPTTVDAPCKLGTDGGSTVVGQVTVGGGSAPTPTPAPATPTPTPHAVQTPTPTPPWTNPSTPKPATPTPTPTPAPTSQPTAQFGYTLQGTTTLNTLTKGSMPLTGAVDASLTLATGDFVADLRLNPTQGRLTVAGFLPVTATVGFVTSGQTTGKLVDDQLTTNSKVRIKVTSVKAFGAIPLAGGNNCQTKQLSDITLKSTDSFDPTSKGGTIAGSYKISDLNGCGPLGGLVSPLTAGGGNTISLRLTPKP